MPLEWIEDRSFGHGFDYGVLLRCCDGARVHPRAMSVPVYSTRNPPLTSAILDHYSRPSLDHQLMFARGSLLKHLWIHGRQRWDERRGVYRPRKRE